MLVSLSHFPLFRHVRYEMFKFVATLFPYLRGQIWHKRKIVIAAYNNFVLDFRQHTYRCNSKRQQHRGDGFRKSRQNHGLFDRNL